MRVRAQRAVQPYAFRHRPPVIPVGEDRVFLTRDGRRMTRNTVHRFVKRLGRQAGVEREHPHLFRHSTRVAFLRGGGSESVLQRILGHDRLDDLLRDADAVVNAAPLTPATVRLFGREQFARMRPTACFVNVGRGETMDQDALIDALRDGVIAAAGPDVTTPEPLPPDPPCGRCPTSFSPPTTPAGPTPCSTTSTQSSRTTSVASIAASHSATKWTCTPGIEQPRGLAMNAGYLPQLLSPSITQG